MDYLGAEISKKIKSAIRAKLVELGVYVDDELPDYIMVLVANKKTKSQMERDLTLFLSDHTVAFVQWLQEVLDKLQTITLAKDKEEEEKSVTKSSSTKEREKKRKSSEVGSESAKKVKSDDPKEKDRKRSSGESHKAKKDKENKNADKESKHVDKESKRTGKESKHADKSTKHSDATPAKKKDDSRSKLRESRERRTAEEKSTRERAAPPAKAADSGGGARSSRSSQSLERESGAEGRSQRRRGVQQAAADSKKHPRVFAPVKPTTATAAAAAAAASPPPEEEEDQDVLNLSAEEDELVKEPAPVVVAARQQPAAAPSRPQAAAAPRQQSVKPTPVVSVAAPKTATVRPASSGASGASGGGLRVVNLREEAGMFGRRVVTEEAPPVRRRSRSRSPVRRREVKVAETESRVVRRGPQSTVGAVVSREVDDTEYDPLNPAVGAVASTVRVTERPRRPANQQPRPTLLLKAMRDAQRSTVASVRPFLVRPQESTKPQRNANKRDTRELYTAGLMSRQRRPPVSAPPTTASDTGAPRAVQARSQRSGSPEQIAITVRNSPLGTEAEPETAVEPTGRSGRRRRRRSRQTKSPPPPRPDTPPAEPVKEAAMEEDGEDPAGSPDQPSSDDEDTVHVTIGKVKAHPQRAEPPAETPEYRPTPVLASVDDISAIVHAVADRIKNPPPQTERPSSPTFVVTMTGLGASRFARSIDSDGALGAEDPPAAEGVVIEEEEEEEEEELEEEDLRAQLLEDRARKRAHPVIAPPAQDPEPAPPAAPAPKQGTTTRCRFWPNCKVGPGCAFHHPTVPCKTFPACKFGDACLYIHPPCKFDGSCTRSDCRFSHSAPRPALATAAAAPVAAFGGSAARQGSITAECRFFPNCNNPTCPYIHPKMCRYGEACTNASCLFAHPSPALGGGRPQFKWVARGAI
ncbi:zinc finger CCCH domain-containing protein 14-like isoform X2 [Amphibalanus amphitrite]|uniref:zinc finger CCCH domain-containing protein 14-like isoform X2 n=1 Tax=Amphibalanus amphitrite TaxID=1232801 RepID=UPI001C92050F|nr:zinc finger CCCH domain-containing protein 14-like isoform X2 [Amphibalanus amphitrite]XP_043231829.1 zinc finger CCCH domain-containing protein 14-like isoform X2 [Amphibalanus amphitrite]XP_043231830.1 zinc finger CCCH domain-containing protein 14-like isoform X2 [Amphibalanus amphitrite]XP_043231831.1 zinc finger CCCH domain-containing protein 14-like isoform X2 [Amphibalanus amphitrite]